jgi:predicted flap endonuclease-1-like 5' DNA nuclease
MKKPDRMTQPGTSRSKEGARPDHERTAMLPQRRISPLATSDDLTLVRGIGQTIAARLKEAGVVSFERLARTPPTELAALLTGTVRRSPEQITAEGWTSQAAALAANSEKHGEERTVDVEARRARHSFTLTLLIDLGSREVIAFKLIDGQAKDSVTIPGWDIDAIVAYMRERAGLVENAGPNGAWIGQVRRRPSELAKVAPTVPNAQFRVGYPFAHGMKLLHAIQPGLVQAVRVRVDASRLRSALPKHSFAVFEFHPISRANGMTALNRTTVDLQPDEPVEFDMPIHLTPSREPVDARLTLWVIAPGSRPPSMPAAIPSLEIDAELLLRRSCQRSDYADTGRLL